MKDIMLSRGDHSPPLVPLLLIVAAVLLIQGTGWADVLEVAGYTAGSFDGGTAACTAVFQGVAIGNESLLTYNCGSFDVTTGSDGSAAIDNLGQFSLTPGFLVGVGVFTLQVTITKPPPNETGSTPLLVAVAEVPISFSGAVGGAVIFDAGQSMNFTSSEGSFSLEVNPLTLKSGETKSLTGQITDATAYAVPESFDLALAGLGTLATVLGRLRRRVA